MRMSRRSAPRSTSSGRERSEIELPIVADDGYVSASELELAQVVEHELLMYSSTVTKTGKFQYGAPEGYHDDTVIALALCVWKASEEPMVYHYDQVRGI